MLLAGGGASTEHLAGAVVLVVHVPVRRAVVLLPARRGAAAPPAGRLLLVGTWASLPFCTGRRHAFKTSCAWHLRLQMLTSTNKGRCRSAQAAQSLNHLHSLQIISDR